MPWPRARAVVRTMAGTVNMLWGTLAGLGGPACHLALTWFPGLGLGGTFTPAWGAGTHMGPRVGLRRRLAARWSVEDEEEAACEQHRRDTERQLQAQDEDEGSPSPEQSEQEKLLSPQPSEAPELDEDEGFGDWSQKPDQQRQQHWGAGETPDAGDPSQGESLEGMQENDRPRQRTSGSQGGDKLSPAEVCLEELHLSPDSEPREGLAPEASEPSGPQEPMQGSPGLAETKEAEAQHQSCRQPRTPSPLVLEGTEVGSPPLSPSTKLSDRTESLNRSIKKSNSVRKSQPALPISKIDERLEQYTQAVEHSLQSTPLYPTDDSPANQHHSVQPTSFHPTNTFPFKQWPSIQATLLRLANVPLSNQHLSMQPMSLL
ncbi:lymphocyte-specific protein 1 isoform X3 [Bubalus bubalis]|uniref:lymphocyte-specific protein 1 isoform X3 n=1 Tax=Bubalus bubalis TaxID=89462 RepID=UPI001D11CFE5|nr:lymphocyte-specific protein 1 isoform X3 [Bubalus bubalis]